jgi:hypothetical protein
LARLLLTWCVSGLWALGSKLPSKAWMGQLGSRRFDEPWGIQRRRIVKDMLLSLSFLYHDPVLSPGASSLTQLPTRINIPALYAHCIQGLNPHSFVGPKSVDRLRDIVFAVDCKGFWIYANVTPWGKRLIDLVTLVADIG